MNMSTTEVAAPIKIDTSMTNMAISPAITGLNSPWSPVSCVSPTPELSPTPIIPNTPITPKSSVYSEKNAMKKKGYIPFKSIGTTLQGIIYRL